MLYEQYFAPVLIVDDEPLVLKQMADVVSALGYFHVRTATSYDAAIEWLHRSVPSVLITDVSLPDGDGRKLALETLKAHPGVTIILITGFQVASLMLAPELRSCAHLLEKPFNLLELRNILMRAGDTAHAWRHQIPA